MVHRVTCTANTHTQQNKILKIFKELGIVGGLGKQMQADLCEFRASCGLHSKLQGRQDYRVGLRLNPNKTLKDAPFVFNLGYSSKLSICCH